MPSLSLITQSVPLASDADGVIRVGPTRVTLDTVVAAFREGLTAESIVEQYPSLALADVYSVIGYYLNHQQQIDAYLRDREACAVETRKDNESRFDPAGIRNRLLNRKRPK